MKPVVVLGSVNADLVTRSSRLPGPGETIAGESFRIFPGGKGANQAFASARLGAPVVFLGAFGSDTFAPILRSSLLSAGVDVRRALQTESASGVAVIHSDHDGANQIVVAPGANAEVSVGYVESLRGLIESAGVLLVQLEIPPDTVARAMEIAAAAGVPVVLDPAPVCPLPPSVLRCVTWLTPNEHEARLLLGSQPAVDERAERDAAHLLMQLGPQNIVLKLGERGAAMLLADGEYGHFPATRSGSAADTTAAGDCFNAAFAVALSRGLHPREAVPWANLAAGISVTRSGAQPSMPSLEEVLAAGRAIQQES